MNASVSIIIPAYNAQAYLEEAVTSCLKQTHKNYDVIIVDDGSTDETKTYCLEAYASTPKVRYVHQSNQGLSGARNRGLDLAQGDFVLFLDADDYLEPNAIEGMLEALHRTAADVVYPTKYYEFNEHTRKERVLFKAEHETLSHQAYLIDIIGTQGRGWRCTSVLYKRAIIEKHAIRFPKGRFSEDVFFNIEYLKNTKKVALYPHTTQNVRRSSGTLTKSYQPTLTDDYKAIITTYQATVMDIAQPSNKHVQEAVSNMVLRNTVLMMRNQMHPNAPHTKSIRLESMKSCVQFYKTFDQRYLKVKKLYSENRKVTWFFWFNALLIRFNALRMLMWLHRKSY